MFHEPVLKQQVLDYLVTQADGVYVDATLGGGGHSQAILERLGRGRLIACDLDEEALAYARNKLAQYAGKVTFFHGNFKQIRDELAELNIQKVNGILLDLGISSHQIDTADRGFSFDKSGRLDMRMDARQSLAAFEIVNRFSERELGTLIKRYGEERAYRSVARAIVKARQKGPIETTRELREVVSSVLPHQHRAKALARVFQALRIAVNDELNNLQEVLRLSLVILAPEGRIVVISYHSLEDRLVKTFFKAEARDCVCPPELPVCVCGREPRLKILTKRPVRPTDDEIKRNPRSRSARLRAAQRTAF